MLKFSQNEVQNQNSLVALNEMEIDKYLGVSMIDSIQRLLQLSESDQVKIAALNFIAALSIRNEASAKRLGQRDILSAI